MIWKIAEYTIIVVFWGVLIGGSGLCVWMLVEPMFKK